MIINKYTAYLIIVNYGLVAFNFNNSKVNTLLMHPALDSFDYVTDYSSNTNFLPYFVGIIVNNDPTNQIYEFLIELFVDPSNEISPLINTIYTTRSYSNIVYIGTDISQYTYFYDYDSQNVISILRAQQTYTIGYNYLLDVSDPINGDSTFLNTYMINDSHDYSATLIFSQNNSTSFSVSSIGQIPSALNCTAKQVGNYSFTFTSYDECIGTNPNTNQVQTIMCETIYNLNYKISNRNLIALWVILSLVLAGAITAGILYIFFRNRICRKNIKTSEDNKNARYMVEEQKVAIEINEKL